MAHTVKTLPGLITGLPGLDGADPEWQIRAKHWTGALQLGVDSELFDFVVEDGRLQLVNSCRASAISR